MAQGEPREVIPIHEAHKSELTTSSVGMIIFLGASSMMFAALFFVYLMLRAREPFWPPNGTTLPLLVPSLNTAIIALSSLTMHRSWTSARSVTPKGFTRWLWATLLLGAAFLVSQTWMWIELWTRGFRVNTDLFSSVYYLLTVIHGLHALIGFVVLASLVPAALWPATLPRRLARLRLVGMFWHFVGAIWLLVFVSVYVV